MKSAAERALAAYAAAPDDPAVIGGLAACRRAAGAVLSAWPPARKSEADLGALGALVRLFVDAGAGDLPAEREEVALADTWRAGAWPGSLAAMLLVPAWQQPGIVRLKAAPRWLAACYADYLFHLPQLLAVPGQAAGLAEVRLLAVEDLVALLESNRGSAAARAALESYHRTETAPVARLVEALRPEIADRRARLVAPAKADAATEVISRLRANRRLRVAVVGGAMDFDRGASTVLPLVERLDRSRFELLRFTWETADSGIDRHLMARGAVRHRFGGSPDEMAQALLDAALDVAIFVPGAAGSTSATVPLCRRRVATVQVVFDGSSVSAAMPGCDLRLAGAEGFTPDRRAGCGRIGLLPGAGVWSLDEFHASEATRSWDRRTMGYGDGEVLLFSLAELPMISCEVQSAWAQVLARVPAARLVLCPPTATTDAARQMSVRFGVLFGRVLAQHGVDESRVSIFPCPDMSHGDRKSCLAAADVLLDVLPVDDGPAVLAALDHGCPVVAWRKPAGGFNPSAALLRLAGVDDLLAGNPAEYVDRAVRLAGDAAGREEFAHRIRQAAPRTRAVHDSFAQSEALGALLEIAFDQIAASRRAFAAGTEPLRAPEPADRTTTSEEARFFLELGSAADAEARARVLLRADPTAPEPRRLLAAAFLQQDRPAEAADLLASAVDLAPDDASLWLELATASRQAQRRAGAVQALETALRLDPKRAEVWRLLADIAGEAGDTECRQRALAVLGELTPGDLRAPEPAATSVA